MWDLTVGLRVLRPGARIFELRKQGHEITTTERKVSGRRVVTYWLSKPTSTANDSNPAPCRSVPFHGIHTRTCIECGQPFESKKRNARFCPGTTHRTDYWKRQQRIREIEGQQSIDFGSERLRSEKNREDNLSTDFQEESTGDLRERGAA